MQKLLLLTLMLPSLSVLAQNNKGGYASLRGGLSFKEGTPKGIASISVGLLSKGAVGIGGGIGYISYEKPYIPLTVDITYFGKPGKVSPVIIAQAGYGVYNYSTAYVTGRGGFTGSLNAGIGLPFKKKNKFLVTVGYCTYGFATTSKVYSSSNSTTVYTKENRFAATFGFKI